MKKSLFKISCLLICGLCILWPQDSFSARTSHFVHRQSKKNPVELDFNDLRRPPNSPSLYTQEQAVPDDFTPRFSPPPTEKGEDFLRPERRSTPLNLLDKDTPQKPVERLKLIPPSPPQETKIIESTPPLSLDASIAEKTGLPKPPPISSLDLAKMPDFADTDLLIKELEALDAISLPDPAPTKRLLKPFFTSRKVPKSKPPLKKKTSLQRKYAPKKIAPNYSTKAAAPVEPVLSEPLSLSKNTTPKEKKKAYKKKTAKKTIPKKAITLPDTTIPFESEQSVIQTEGMAALDTVLKFLKENPNTRLQIRAFASDTETSHSTARRLSLSRGLSVRSYLTKNGIAPIRLDVRALGAETEKTPIDRVDLILKK